jgi:hypothetical protein
VVRAANSDPASQEENVQCIEGNPCPNIPFDDKAVYTKFSLLIAENLQLRKEILDVEYDLMVATHMGQNTIF